MPKTTYRLLQVLLAVFGLSMASMPVWATPFLFTYRTTIEIAVIAGINAGDEVVISVLADNGGTSPISAVWNEADLISATLTAGSYTAHYGAPLIADLNPTFRTDALGMLERVVFLGGIAGTNFDSFGVGGYALLYDNVFFDFFGNPAILSDPLSGRRLDLWTGPTAVSVPEPATLVLFASGLLALAAARRRRIDRLCHRTAQYLHAPDLP